MTGRPTDREPNGSFDDVVVVSNRGPLSFRQDPDGQLIRSQAAGGLAGSLYPIMAGTGATWVACALSDADRLASAQGLMVEDGLRIELLDLAPDVYRMAYDVVSNATLWFCHHHLFDAARRPRSDGRWSEAWEAYREYNRLFADRVAEVAPEGGRVLVQDYHLTLVGSELARERPDLKTVHFTHTPFADPSVLRMLPTAVVDELLAGMAGFGACGFHTDRWAAGYRACHDALSPGRARPPTFVSGLAPDPDRLIASITQPGVAEARARLESEVGGPDRQMILRVDRMELSKNLLRGFWAYEELLSNEPAWRERVVFVALAYPSRQGLAEYLGYQNEVESTVARINEHWATPGWTPIVLHVEDDYPRSLAALTCYDVLLVNPIRDGMNLVAKEGPLVNGKDGVLALSREAGAFEELAGPAVEVNPFDVGGTAAVLARALSMKADERAAAAKSLRALVTARSPADWFDDQLEQADRIG
ncbi:MAG: trehalose 6-phosphate synthase [Acidimicrobiaceae bacterium]|nr:trehalose 6-phosphate synthase [Acidimicrobiaceae bacterium]